jgi:hypothetical protein
LLFRLVVNERDPGVLPESSSSMDWLSPSSMPSLRLEQEAQTLGLRDKELPCVAIGSPQQMQMRRHIAAPARRGCGLLWGT